MICGECLLSRFGEEERKKTVITEIWCPKKNHFSKGKQEALEIFGVDCAICLEPAAEKYDRICEQRVADEVNRMRMSCGKL